jgi:beta-lactam-binding protein with PASTA domain
VLVARKDDPGDRATADGEREAAPVVSLVADGPPGTVPDLSGLSARDAVRRLVKLGMSARVTGDGFVVSQVPPAGAPIDGDAVCHLILQRWPTRHAADPSRP